MTMDISIFFILNSQDLCVILGANLSIILKNIQPEPSDPQKG